MQLTKATSNNIERVDNLVELSLKNYKNIPYPSWIELSIIDACNRTCKFCPKNNDEIAPNQSHLIMNLSSFHKIFEDLKKINYNGVILLAGFGEPLLSPHVMQAVEIFSEMFHTEIVTNGDFLNEEKINEMIKYNISFINVSIYSNKERYNEVENMFLKLNIPKEKYMLRDRWYDESKDFGVKLTNRCGLVNIGNQPPINNKKQCFYPFYSMVIDWNGDVLLCPQDWNRRIKFGNIHITPIKDIWFSSAYVKYRQFLYEGERNKILPCCKCNCDGTYHGANHAKLFHKQHYEWKNNE